MPTQARKHVPAIGLAENGNIIMKATEFITEAIDSDAINELKLFIMNNEDLYRRQFMPIIYDSCRGGAPRGRHPHACRH